MKFKERVWSPEPKRESSIESIEAIPKKGKRLVINPIVKFDDKVNGRNRLANSLKKKLFQTR